MLFRPSYYADFARSAGEAEYPELWRSLVGCWSPALGVTGNKLFDHSGFGNHGTLTSMDSATDWLISGNPRFPGHALDFDGTNDYINLPNSLINFVGDLTTVSAWVKIDAYDTNGFLLFGTDNGAGANCYWQIATDTRVYLMANQINFSAINFDDGAWHHFTFVSDGTNSRFFMDGEDVAGDTDAVVSLVSGPKDFAIGDWIGGLGGDFNLNGQISDLLAYNRALTPTEIHRIHADPFYHPLTLKTRILWKAPVAVGLSMPIAMHHFTKNIGVCN